MIEDRRINPEPRDLASIPPALEGALLGLLFAALLFASAYA